MQFFLKIVVNPEILSLADWHDCFGRGARQKPSVRECESLAFSTIIILGYTRGKRTKFPTLCLMLRKAKCFRSRFGARGLGGSFFSSGVHEKQSLGLAAGAGNQDLLFDSR